MVTVLPRMIAPAARQPKDHCRILAGRRIAGELRAVAGWAIRPTSKMSLIPSGMPARGRSARKSGSSPPRRLGLGHGPLAIDGDPGVNPLVPAIDAAQAFGQQIAWFERALGNGLAGFGDHSRSSIA